MKEKIVYEKIRIDKLIEYNNIPFYYKTTKKPEIRGIISKLCDVNEKEYINETQLLCYLFIGKK